MKFFSKAFFIGLVAFLSLSNIVFAEDTTRINLNIYTYDGSLYSGEINVSACYENEGGTSSSINAFCAIEKVANENNWQINKTWYPFGVTLDGLHTYTADFSNNRFWVYFINDNPGEVGLNSYLLKENDKLDLFFGVSPLKISTNNLKPKSGDSVDVTANFFDFMTWGWLKPQTVRFVINGISRSSDENSALNFIAENNTNYEIFAEGDGFVKSNILTISTNLLSQISLPPPPAGGGGCAYCEAEEQKILKTFNISKAENFLKENLFRIDNSKNEMLMDWASIALASFAKEEDLLKIKQFLISNPLKDDSLVTDYERRAMALMSLGIDPYNAGLNYIEKITSSFIGGQFGSPDMFNDDAFAIMVLTKAGFSKENPMIKDALDFLIRAQNIENGSWQNVDLTSASISAVSLFKGNRREDDVLKRAIGYLKKSQKKDGGFGDPFSTSWAIQAIYAYGEDPKTWVVSGRNPIDYLASLQDNDGGISLKDGYIENRIWATAYSLPSVGGLAWSKILKQFDKPITKESVDSKILTDNKVDSSTLENVFDVKKIDDKKSSKNFYDSKQKSKNHTKNQASVALVLDNPEKKDKNVFKIFIKKVENLFDKIFYNNL
jgi:hypothetical protein